MYVHFWMKTFKPSDWWSTSSQSATVASPLISLANSVMFLLAISHPGPPLAGKSPYNRHTYWTPISSHENILQKETETLIM